MMAVAAAGHCRNIYQTCVSHSVEDCCERETGGGGGGRTCTHTAATHLPVAVGEQLVLQQRGQHPEGSLLAVQAHHNQQEASNVGQATKVACSSRAVQQYNQLARRPARTFQPSCDCSVAAKQHNTLQLRLKVAIQDCSCCCCYCFCSSHHTATGVLCSTHCCCTRRRL